MSWKQKVFNHLRFSRNFCSERQVKEFSRRGCNFVFMAAQDCVHVKIRNSFIWRCITKQIFSVTTKKMIQRIRQSNANWSTIRSVIQKYKSLNPFMHRAKESGTAIQAGDRIQRFSRRSSQKPRNDPENLCNVAQKPNRQNSKKWLIYYAVTFVTKRRRFSSQLPWIRCWDRLHLE